MKKINNKYLRLFIRVKNIILVAIIILLFLIIVVTMIARLTGATPEFFGNSLYRVSSGSMEPELKIGDVILTQSCDPEKLVKGDIVTYNVESGKLNGRTITHRVVRAAFSKDGKRYIQTKGDANSYSDKDVLISDVKGKYVCKIELLNTLYSFFVTPLGLITLIALIIIAFFNEIVIFVKAVMGIGYEEEKKDSVDDIIARYQNENNKLHDSEESSEKDIDSGG